MALRPRNVVGPHPLVIRKTDGVGQKRFAGPAGETTVPEGLRLCRQFAVARKFVFVIEIHECLFVRSIGAPSIEASEVFQVIAKLGAIRDGRDTHERVVTSNGAE